MIFFCKIDPNLQLLSQYKTIVKGYIFLLLDNKNP